VFAPFSLVSLAIFVALVLAASLYALAVSGHFPRAGRRPAMATRSGEATIWASGILVLLAIVAGVVAAWHAIPWYAVVIGAGLAILLAPLVLQQCGDAFVDGPRALIAFSGSAAILAAALVFIAPLSSSWSST
jgi:hypothetical protein